MRGEPYPKEPLRKLIAWAVDSSAEESPSASDALFRVLAEGMADRFEPRLCITYARIFSEVIAAARPELSAAELLSRYHRVRQPRCFTGEPRTVFVLSRVTLGADIAVTSVVLDGTKRRFPCANVYLVGGEKSRLLFAADPRIGHISVAYGRGGSLRERLAVWPQLRAALSRPDSIVIDPDSRLTQLGLLPVCPEENYYFFESRSYGGDGDDSLTALTRRWFAEIFAADPARPYIAPAEPADLGSDPVVAISLGVGENPAKRLPDPFEEELVRTLGRTGAVLLLDKGAGRDEADRVERAIRRSGVPQSRVLTWQGSFSAFAAMIGKSHLYIGYDSAGQHAAAAAGTPLVSVFAGFASPRMFARWRPTGPGPVEVVRVDRPDPAAVLEETLAAVNRLGVL